MELDIKTLLNDWVTSLPKKEYNRLSPSSLGGCPRAHYWKVKGVAETTPPNPGALLNFQVGFLWEKIWEDALKWKGAEFKSQVAFEDEEYNIGGTCDFLVKTGKDEWEIWDSKTQGSKWFWYIQSQIAAGKYDELKEEYGYIMQQAAYMWLARRNGFNVVRARLAYISKDDGIVGKITTVELTSELEADLLGRIEYLNKCLKNGTLPTCSCEGWKVGYCGFGNPSSRIRNRTKKLVNSECCDPKLIGKE